MCGSRTEDADVQVLLSLWRPLALRILGYWAYLYGPMLLLLLVNVGFFVGCVVLLSGGRGRVTFTPSSDQHQISSEWIFDTINSLQGVLVFIVTVCCRRDLKVFHCGRPQLIQKGRHSEVATEASEMTAAPLVS
ncbi:hypothetical protein GWK47_034846 [Chionoecetes opilio]|uniref:Uncharacterized protein n=1 Tax=Chionoecetes opilio TaxID=41210 RepID=A0A8J4YHH3_CHIOP|nr:hypothetical protein GWK47_034846 [Chionoecetes opilio]